MIAVSVVPARGVILATYIIPFCKAHSTYLVGNRLPQLILVDHNCVGAYIFVKSIFESISNKAIRLGAQVLAITNQKVKPDNPRANRKNLDITG